MRYRITVFVLVLFALLAGWLEWAYRYHFFFIEQNQLFLFTSDYFCDAITKPGGMARWVGEFFVQFFTLPGAGAIITASMLTAAGVLAALLGRRMASGVPMYLLWVLPALGLLCIHFDFNYFYQGTVALLATLGALLVYVRPARWGRRMVCGLVTVPGLWWLCGPVALLYGVSAVVWEAAAGNRRWWLATAVPVWAASIAWASAHFSLAGELRWAFTPHLYYSDDLVPGPQIWFAWAGVVAVIAGARLCRGLRTASRRGEAVSTAAQIAVAALVVWAGVAKYDDSKSYHLKKLDHYSRNGQWDAIVKESQDWIGNYMYLNILNLALAEKGRLADEMFSYDQRGVEGLVLGWNQQLVPAIIRSDIFFCIGNVAIAQEMAFEGDVICNNEYGSPRLMQRLVQTNLIYGAWPVAEKYLDILSHTLMYRGWTDRYRRFLGDDAAVEADPVLGEKRRCLPNANRLSQTPFEDTEAIAKYNPRGKTAVEYLGAMMLLSKNMDLFRSFVDDYYGRGNASGELPRAFQEAVVILWETEPAMWDRYGVSDAVRERFEGFKSRLQANSANRGLGNIMRGAYGDTFWFYLIFKKI